MMQEPPLIDYLAIGHVAKDLTTDGYSIGGTVSFSGRTALSLGLSVAVVTSCSGEFDLSALNGIQIKRQESKKTTTFVNTYSEGLRTQKITAKAEDLNFRSIPVEWRSAKIVHLAPIAWEVDPELTNRFPSAFVGITPQGWLREWDSSNAVRHTSWESIQDFCPKADAVVLSLEDLQYDSEAGDFLAEHCQVLAVTKAAQGATVYWKNERYDLPAIKSIEVDSTGAGDIFASAFFVRLYEGYNPVQAGIFANKLAAGSITREGIDSTPTFTEIYAAGVRVQA